MLEKLRRATRAAISNRDSALRWKAKSDSTDAALKMCRHKYEVASAALADANEALARRSAEIQRYEAALKECQAQVKSGELTVLNQSQRKAKIKSTYPDGSDEVVVLSPGGSHTVKKYPSDMTVKEV